MRTLDAALTAASEADVGIPHVSINFRNTTFTSGIESTFTTEDTDYFGGSRILSVEQAEGQFGSFIVKDGQRIGISSVIRLDNSDGKMEEPGYTRGARVYIEWGFKTSTGIKTSRGGPEIVMVDNLVSDRGKSYLEIYTANLWEIANLVFVNTSNVVPTSWIEGASSEKKVSHILLELLGGGGFNAAIQYNNDDTTFNDMTANSKETTAGNVDMFLADGMGTAIEVADEFYFGMTNLFDRITVDISEIISSGSVTILWEYSKGSDSFGTLSALTASVGGQAPTLLDLSAATGIKIVAFDVPSDWATDTQNSQGPFYYIRARVTAVSTPVGNIKGTIMQGGTNFAFELDTSDAAQGDDVKPSYTTSARSSLGQTLADIMTFTQMGLRVEEDGFHAFFLDNNQVGQDYRYDLRDGPHTFYNGIEISELIVPNTVLVVSASLSGGTAAFSGSSESASSVGVLGNITRIEVRPGVTTNGEAATLAASMIEVIERDSSQAELEAPMNVGQELYDKVVADDQRVIPITGRSLSGRVTQLVRKFAQGEYLIHVVMGGSPRAIEIGLIAPFVPELPPVIITTPISEPLAPIRPIDTPRPTLAPAPTPGEPTPIPTPTPAPVPRPTVPLISPVPVPGRPAILPPVLPAHVPIPGEPAPLPIVRPGRVPEPSPSTVFPRANPPPGILERVRRGILDRLRSPLP